MEYHVSAHMMAELPDCECMRVPFLSNADFAPPIIEHRRPAFTTDSGKTSSGRCTPFAADPRPSLQPAESGRDFCQKLAPLMLPYRRDDLVRSRVAHERR